MPLKTSDLSVGEVARRAGVPVSTLHFYEAQGLIVSHRTKGNQRRYHRSILRMIAVIKIAQRTGIPLAQIRQSMAHLPIGQPLGVQDWALLSENWMRDLDQRISWLTRLRDDFNSCIGCGCLSMTDCPLRNPDDVAGQKGPGARAFDEKACAEG